MNFCRSIPVLLALCALSPAALAAETAYPSRPIRIIVPFPPGGTTDVVARLMGQKLTEAWGQQVVVDNRAGAGGNIGMGLAAVANPDGYTILAVSSSYMVNPTLYSRAPYDPFKSFLPITNAAASPNIFTAHASVPVKSMQELIALVKKDGKKFNIGTPGVGTTPDLSAELLRMTVKLDIARVPYSGAGPAVAAVAGNQVPIACTVLPPVVPHIQAGRLRGLAVTAQKRSSTLPDVPTMAEVGFKGQEADTISGLLVPAGTPKAVLTKLSAEMQRILAQPDIRERIAAQGFEIIASTPEQFAAQIRMEVEKWGKVIRAARIRVD
ncbi:MAG: extra-cytoplasmic solute receptor [Betaproteobacteria bacterium]|nr:extra-cytoplasmic solute receptor [Betaproteobacteria bacterium]